MGIWLGHGEQRCEGTTSRASCKALLAACARSNGVFQVVFFMGHLARSVELNAMGAWTHLKAQRSLRQWLPCLACLALRVRFRELARHHNSEGVITRRHTTRNQTKPDTVEPASRLYQVAWYAPAPGILDLSDLDLPMPQGLVETTYGAFTPERLRARPARFGLPSRGAGSRPWEWRWRCGCLRLTN